MTETMIKAVFLGTIEGLTKKNQIFNCAGKTYPRNVVMTITEKEARKLFDLAGNLFRFEPPIVIEAEKTKPAKANAERKDK